LRIVILSIRKKVSFKSKSYCWTISLVISVALCLATIPLELNLSLKINLQLIGFFWEEKEQYSRFY